MKVKKSDLLIVIWGMLVAHVSYIYISVLRVPQYSNYRIAMGVIALIFSLRVIKMLFAKNGNYNFLLVTFCCSALLSTILYSGASGYYYSLFLFLISVMCPFLYVQYLNIVNKIELGSKTIFWCMAIYCIISDILMIFFPMSDVPLNIAEYYFLGNKFQVCYTHLFTIGFYSLAYHKNDKFSWKIVLMIAVTIFVAWYTECTTAIIGGTIFILLYIFWDKIKGVLQSPLCAIICTVIACLMLLVNAAILTIPEVEYFIVDVLNEDVTLTGRIEAYSRILPMLANHWLFGFGIDKNMAVSFDNLGIANAQNGVIDSIVSFGIVGTVLMLVMLICSIKKGKNKSNRTFYIIIYVLILLSAVETTMNLKFYTILAMLAFGWNSNIMNTSKGTNDNLL